VYEQNIDPGFPPLFLNRNGVDDRERVCWHHRKCWILLGSGQLIWPYLQLMMRRTIVSSDGGRGTSQDSNDNLPGGWHDVGK